MSPTPFVLERLDDSPALYGFETVIPISICSERNGEIVHLNFTKPYRDNILDIGYSGIHHFQDTLNTSSIFLAERLREIMAIAKQSKEVESMDFISAGKHCHLQARLVSGIEEMILCFPYTPFMIWFYSWTLKRIPCFRYIFVSCMSR